MGANQSVCELSSQRACMTPNGGLLSPKEETGDNGKLRGIDFRLLTQNYVNGKARKVLETADVLLTRSMRHELENFDKVLILEQQGKQKSKKRSLSTSPKAYSNVPVDAWLSSNGFSVPTVDQPKTNNTNTSIDEIIAQELRVNEVEDPAPAPSIGKSQLRSHNKVEELPGARQLIATAKRRVVKKARRHRNLAMASSTAIGISTAETNSKVTANNAETISPSLSEVQVSQRLWSPTPGTDEQSSLTGSSSTLPQGTGMLVAAEPYYVFTAPLPAASSSSPEQQKRRRIEERGQFSPGCVANGLINHKSPLKDVLVPQWRIVPPGPPCNPPLDPTTGYPLELVDDATFQARHFKQEADERRCQKMERIWRREMELRERFEAKERRIRERLGLPSLEPPEDKPTPTILPTSLAPDLSHVESIIVKKDIPVVAFGRPVPLLPKLNSDFQLPWMSTRNSIKVKSRLRR